MLFIFQSCFELFLICIRVYVNNIVNLPLQTYFYTHKTSSVDKFISNSKNDNQNIFLHSQGK